MFSPTPKRCRASCPPRAPQPQHILNPNRNLLGIQCWQSEKRTLGLYQGGSIWRCPKLLEELGIQLLPHFDDCLAILDVEQRSLSTRMLGYQQIQHSNSMCKGSCVSRQTQAHWDLKHLAYLVSMKDSCTSKMTMCWISIDSRCSVSASKWKVPV